LRTNSASLILRISSGNFGMSKRPMAVRH
jgi:hypothetical protein